MLSKSDTYSIPSGIFEQDEDCVDVAVGLGDSLGCSVPHLMAQSWFAEGHHSVKNLFS